MKTLALLLVLLLSLSSIGPGTGTRLYPIREGNLWGYINSAGKVVIKPQFYAAGEFAEGLAAVRSGGRYGYINPSGSFVIAPTYDLAFLFEQCQAKVFLDGKPFYINKKGSPTFSHNFKAILGFRNGYSQVQTHTNKTGMINRQGQLVLDTAYKHISPFTPDGVAVVTGLNHDPYSKNGESQVGVVDTRGNWVVKYGLYRNIDEFQNGFAVVQLNQDGRYNNEGIIDTRGNYKFTVPSRKWTLNYREKAFHCGLAVVQVYSVDPDTVKVWSSDNHYQHPGAVNSKGELLFANPAWYDLTPFSHNRAFARDKNKKWHLIDRTGKVLVDKPFDKLLFDPYSGSPDDLFRNGMAFVQTGGNWGAIDTTGKFVVPLTDLDDLEYDRLIRKGNIIFLEEDISDQDRSNPYRYGFWDTRTNHIVAPKYQGIGLPQPGKELLHVMVNGQPGYITYKGKQVWKASANADKKQRNLNIDFMNRGYYYASSKYIQNLAGYGGWGSSDNKAKPIKAVAGIKPGQLQVILDPTQKTEIDNFEAIKLFVANTASDTLFFDAQDSRLYLKIQAKDQTGNWRDIEYLPSSWCGNSYHTLFLAPNELWEFKTPVYHGEIKTKLRAQLLYKTSAKQEDDVPLYSNEIEASVNPGQFWNKLDYNPAGLMDPYLD